MEESQDIRFLEHLELLRKELIKIICIVACAAIPCWFLAPAILDFLLDFAAPVGFKLHYFTLLEPFLTRLKITVLLAVVLIACAKSGVFDVLAMALPLLFVRPAMLVTEFFRKKEGS